MPLGSGCIQINTKTSKNDTLKEGSEIANCIKMAGNRLEQGLWWF